MTVFKDPALKRIGILAILTLLAMGLRPADGLCSEWVHVKWVVDGDTIVLRDGRHVRYIGIDTPEIRHEDQPAEPLAVRALSVNRQIVEGRRLRLVYDRQRTDRYGRTLAYVYRGDGLLVNAELLEKGVAHVLYQWPNSSKTRHLLEYQRNAMQRGIGIWQHVRKDARPDRPYRGNRRSKRFHRPDCPLGQTMAPKNLVWMKNQWAACWAGYAPARECIAFP